MKTKEAKARIKINKLLEESGWLFFDTDNKKSNIALEANTTITESSLDELGDNFENIKNGFIDFLLLDKNNFPIIVLEAKKSSINPLDAKEKTRIYCKSLNVNFAILSNGDTHYFWDILKNNPIQISKFPSPSSIEKYADGQSSKSKFDFYTKIEDTFIAETQYPDYLNKIKNFEIDEINTFNQNNNLKILRPYQLNAIKSIQEAVKLDKNRFLFEMATGTGKTLVASAIIKLFLKSAKSKRILFLVDRLELEDQAYKNISKNLKNDFLVNTFKNSDEWIKSKVIISTLQSLVINDKYRKLFSPTDFDFIISDEAHRSIYGNSRGLFEYFIGFKLGLTATPKNFFRNINIEKLAKDDPKNLEKRELNDTYITFGCSNGIPTFKYDLIKGVKEGYLVNPSITDARTDITTKLLSDEGLEKKIIKKYGDNEVEEERTFFHTDYEKNFFSQNTNYEICKSFLENALKDPISNEIGKSIFFCVNQEHASKITHILNEYAMKIWEGKYNSDFAVQVTSNIELARTFSQNFANNNLNGFSNFMQNYKTSKTRVCVTVSMMTTGYDCEDLLNICFLRPIFSPSSFIQMKGRGTRKFDFRKDDMVIEKKYFKIFDYFAVCEFFEGDEIYNEVLKLPSTKKQTKKSEIVEQIKEISIKDPDKIRSIQEKLVGDKGMRIDREYFSKVNETISNDKILSKAIHDHNWDYALDYFKNNYENKPELFITLEKIKKIENLDRNITWREYLEKLFGIVDKIKSRDELIEEEIEKFILIEKPDYQLTEKIKNFFYLYLNDEYFRDIIDTKQFSNLSTYQGFDLQDFKSMKDYKDKIIEYSNNYINF